MAGSQTHGRFQSIEFILEDTSGIDPASIQLTFSGGLTFTSSSPQLTFDGRHLVYQNSDTAIGAYGQSLTVTLTVADPLGNVVIHPVAFSLEKEAVVSSNLFVFGSVAAQRAGQKLMPGAMSDWVRQTQGPVPASGADEWFVTGVDATFVTIGYTGDIPPSFATGTYVANKAPNNTNEIFYRKILSSVQAAPPLKQLTLYTVDVPVEEIVEHGTCTSYAPSPMLDVAANGALTPSAEQPGDRFGISHTFPRMGLYLANNLKIPTTGNPKIQIEARDASIWSTFTLGASVEISNRQIQCVEASLTADVELVQRWSAIYHAPGDNLTEDGKPFRHSLHTPVIKLIPAGAIGIVPLFLVLEYKTDLVIDGNASADITLNLGATDTYSRSTSFKWKRGDLSPDMPLFSGNQPTRRLDPITLTSGGTASVSIGLEPRVSLTFMKLGGAYLKVNPRIQGSVTASGGFGYDFEQDRWDWHAGESVQASAGFIADFTTGLTIIGMEDSNLPHLAAYPILNLQRELTWPQTPLQVTVPAGGMSIYGAIGDTITLDGQATGGTAAISYQWFQNGKILPQFREKTLSLPIRSLADAGDYWFEAKSGEESMDSSVYNLGVGSSPVALTAPVGFSRIDGGSFTMGRTSGDTDSNAPPVTVTVSTFYMAKYETTKELWDEVRAWGMANDRGYTDLRTGNGSYASKGINHPVHTVSWWDVVKWCNARSEKEGLVAVYRNADGTVFKAGTAVPTPNWSANGYRLPTEAEWEKAARGNVSGKRYPWGTDTITHSQANYNSSTSYAYDVSPTRGYHPSYTAGGTPYTAPVDSFTANGYGLFNMSGNVWEWCWDWYGSSTYVNGATNPIGATSGSLRVFRGGGWGGIADDCRTAILHSYPASSGHYVGFRPARSSVP